MSLSQKQKYNWIKFKLEKYLMLKKLEKYLRSVLKLSLINISFITIKRLDGWKENQNYLFSIKIEVI